MSVLRAVDAVGASIYSTFRKLLTIFGKSTSVQNAAINHVLAERRKKVYAVEPDSGAILVENGNIHLIGNVQFFEMIRE